MKIAASFLAVALALVRPAPAPAVDPAAAAPVEGKQTQVTLTLSPASLTLAPGDTARVVAVIRNAGPSPVHAIELRALAPPGLTTEIEPPVASLQAGGSAVSVLKVERQREGRIAGDLQLLATYTVAENTRGAAVSTLPVQGRAATAAMAVASVSTKSAMAELEERKEGGLVFVVVTNTSGVPIEIERVRPYYAPFLQVVPEMGGLAFTRREGMDLSIVVPPGHSQALPFRVTAKSAVEPGDQMIVWQVEVSWEEDGRAQRGNLVADSRFKVGVLGESEVLNALKVPSLFLLPGVLFLLTFRGLSKGLRNLLRKDSATPNEETKETEAKPAGVKESILEILSPGLAAGAVLFSLAVTFLYPSLTGLRGEPRDLLVRYGLEDIYNVCFLSVLLGILACGSWYGLDWSRRKAERWWRERRTPGEGDTPRAILRKLARRGIDSVALEQVEVKSNGGSRRAFILLRQAEGLWVAPAMRLEWRTARTGPLQDRLEEILEDGRTDETASFFEQTDEVDLFWKPSGEGAREGPRKVSAADILGSRKGRRRMIEL